MQAAVQLVATLLLAGAPAKEEVALDAARSEPAKMITSSMLPGHARPIEDKTALTMSLKRNCAPVASVLQQADKNGGMQRMKALVSLSGLPAASSLPNERKVKLFGDVLADASGNPGSILNCVM